MERADGKMTGAYVQRLSFVEVKFVLLIRCEQAGGILNLAHPAAANEATAELQKVTEIKHETKL